MFIRKLTILHYEKPQTLSCPLADNGSSHRHQVLMLFLESFVSHGIIQQWTAATDVWELP